MLLGMVNDPRVVLIKLADRLHNMRTMYALRYFFLIVGYLVSRYDTTGLYDSPVSTSRDLRRLPMISEDFSYHLKSNSHSQAMFFAPC